MFSSCFVRALIICCSVFAGASLRLDSTAQEVPRSGGNSSRQMPLVVVTGATSGIGAQVAKDFSAKGHPLLLIGRRIERCESLGLPNALCERVDVTDLAAFQAAVQKAEVQFGPVHCIVNNAGVMLLGQM